MQERDREQGRGGFQANYDEVVEKGKIPPTTFCIKPCKRTTTSQPGSSHCLASCSSLQPPPRGALRPSRLHPRHESCEEEGSPLHPIDHTPQSHTWASFSSTGEIKACLLYALSHAASYITNLFNWWITGLHITFVRFMCHCESNHEMKVSLLGQIKAMVGKELVFF